MGDTIMSKKSYIPIAEFCEKYEVSYKTIMVRRATKSLPEHIFKKPKGYPTLIDENYFIRAKDFQTKIIQMNQDFYAYMTQHTSNSRLAKIVHQKYDTTSIGTLNNYFSLRLFYIPTSPISYRINRTHWTFNKWVRLTLRDLDMTIEEVRDALYT